MYVCFPVRDHLLILKITEKKCFYLYLKPHLAKGESELDLGIRCADGKEENGSLLWGRESQSKTVAMTGRRSAAGWGL